MQVRGKFWRREPAKPVTRIGASADKLFPVLAEVRQVFNWFLRYDKNIKKLKCGK